MNYACLFGGGAIRGLAHVGVVRALKELNIGIGTLAGSSVGAIVASFLAVGYDDKELEQILLDVDFELFKDIDFSKSVAFSKGNIFVDWMREVIESKFYGADYIKGENPHVTFKDLDKNLVIVTTDLSNFRCQEFSKYTTPDFEIAEAVRISACMPGLMKPVEYENCLLVDGDLQKSWPMWKLCETLSKLDENILEIRLEGSVSTNLSNPILYLNTVYSCVTSIATNFVTGFYKGDEQHDCMIINTGDVVIVDFRLEEASRKALIKSGYEQAMLYFKNVLPKKKQLLLDNYIKLKNLSVDIQNLILDGKVGLAQVKYGNILTILCDVKGDIDEKIYDELLALKTEMLENTGKTLFLKQLYLKNAQEVIRRFERLETILKSKQTDLQAFLGLVSA